MYNSLFLSLLVIVACRENYYYCFFLSVDEKIEEDRKECEKMAKSVLNSLRNVIDKIQKTHPCCKGLKYEFGLKCDLCDPKQEKCLRHGQQGCDDGNCVCIMSLMYQPLMKGKKRRVSCRKNNFGKVLSKLHESAWFKAFGKKKESIY